MTAEEKGDIIHFLLLNQIAGLLKNDTKELSLKILEKIYSQNIQIRGFNLKNAWTVNGSPKYKQYLF